MTLLPYSTLLYIQVRQTVIRPVWGGFSFGINIPTDYKERNTRAVWAVFRYIRLFRDPGFGLRQVPAVFRAIFRVGKYSSFGTFENIVKSTGQTCPE